MPDAWETARGLNKNNKADATAYSTTNPGYLNIEVYVNSLVSPTMLFVKNKNGIPTTNRPLVNNVTEVGSTK